MPRRSMVLLSLLWMLRSAHAQEPETGPGTAVEATGAPEAPAEAPTEVPAETPVETPPETPSPREPLRLEQPVTAPFADVLEVAKRQYFAGDVDEAMKLLHILQQRVAFGEEVDRDLSAEALIYLGEIQYGLGKYDAAIATFRQVLERDPEHPINPYHHPTEVVGQFELVRLAVRKEAEDREALLQPQLPPKVPPLPLWGYVPFGVPQLNQGQTGRAVIYATLQGGFAATSLAMLAHLRAVNGTLLRPTEWTDQEYDRMVRRVQLQRWLVQLPATAGFYFTWYASVVDGKSQWRAHAIGVTLSTPDGKGAALRVSWRF